MDVKWLFYIVFCGVRVYYVILPQTGYIHPDEFFQSVEVVAGDILNVSHHRAWEFNSTNPLRSIVPPYLISALPFLLVKHFVQAGIIENSSYYYLIGPRIIMLLYSFVLDTCLYRLSRIFNLQSSLVLMCLSVSYITLIYQTRTFLNSLETLLVSIFLLLVIESLEHLKHKNRRNGKESKRNRMTMYAASKQSTVIEKCETSQCGRGGLAAVYIILMCIVGVLGVFNRPTFIAFTIGPSIWWLYHMLKCVDNATFGKPPNGGFPNVALSTQFKMPNVWSLFKLLGLIIPTVILTFVVMVVADSLYYSDMNLRTCDSLSDSWKHCIFKKISTSIVITPLNFIKYNTATDNLKQHGLHPRYLHFMVNFPLLFGPFAIIIYKCYADSLYEYIKRLLSGDSGKRSYETCDFPFLLMIITSIGLLSVFPHQEPRFIIPLLPFVFLKVSTYLQHTTMAPFLYNTTLLLWIVFNSFMSSVYGFLHQGAVTTSLCDFQKGIATKSTINPDRVILIYFQTYMPPYHLLIDDQNKFCVKDLKGSDIQELEKAVKSEHMSQRTTYVVLPSTVEVDVLHALNNTIQLVHRLHYHLSTENLPKLDISCLWLVHSVTEFYDCVNIVVDSFVSQLTLSIFLVK